MDSVHEGDPGLYYLFNDYNNTKDVESYIPVYQDTTSPSTVFRSLIVKAGLQVKKCETKEIFFTFSNHNQAVAAVKAVNPFLERIPPDLQSDFITECMGTLILLSNSEPGRIEAR